MAFSKPIFPFIRFPRPAALIIPPPEEHSHLASRLTSLSEIPGFFDSALKSTILDLQELTWYSEWTKPTQTPPGTTSTTSPTSPSTPSTTKPETTESTKAFSPQTESYFNNEVLYVEYALHRDRYTPDTGLLKGDASITGCVRLASLLFHNSAIWDFYPSMAPVFPKPVIALRCALEATIPPGCYALCRDLLIWVLFIGACSSSLLPVERSFFVTQLADAVVLQGCSSWQELRALLLRFFYVDRKFLMPLRALWDEMRI